MYTGTEKEKESISHHPFRISGATSQIKVHIDLPKSADQYFLCLSMVNCESNEGLPLLTVISILLSLKKCHKEKFIVMLTGGLHQYNTGVKGDNSLDENFKTKYPELIEKLKNAGIGLTNWETWEKDNKATFTGYVETIEKSIEKNDAYKQLLYQAIPERQKKSVTPKKSEEITLDDLRYAICEMAFYWICAENKTTIFYTGKKNVIFTVADEIAKQKAIDTTNCWETLGLSKFPSKDKIGYNIISSLLDLYVSPNCNQPLSQFFQDTLDKGLTSTHIKDHEKLHLLTQYFMNNDPTTNEKELIKKVTSEICKDNSKVIKYLGAFRPTQENILSPDEVLALHKYFKKAKDSRLRSKIVTENETALNQAAKNALIQCNRDYEKAFNNTFFFENQLKYDYCNTTTNAGLYLN